MEQDIHGPGLTPMAPHSRARTCTSSSDTAATMRGRPPRRRHITDTFAVPLCNPAGGRVSTKSDYYVLRGKCVQMRR